MGDFFWAPTEILFDLLQTLQDDDSWGIVLLVILAAASVAAFTPDN